MNNQHSNYWSCYLSYSWHNKK